MKFTLTDIDYDKVIKLYGDSDKERVIIKDPKFKPYFYVKGLKRKDIKSVSEHEVVSVEESDKGLKVVVATPKDIPVISESLKSKGGKVLESDIPTTKRYLLDKGLVMLEGVEDLKHCEREWKPRVIALDIETTNKKGVPDTEIDEVLMISLWSNYGTKKVMLTKECKIKNTESFPDEKSMLQALSNLIIKDQPSIIVTYNGDAFDWPFLRDRMNKYKVTMKYGYDNSRMTIINRSTGSTARIKGLSHIDLYPFIKRILSSQLKTSKLDLGSVSSELINNTKREMNWNEFYNEWDKGKLDKIVDYSLQDAKVTYKLFKELKTIIYELSKLVNKPLYETCRSSYSSLVENYLINKAHAQGRLIPSRPNREEISERYKETFVGGYVHQPNPGIYENIAVVDFRSLYPTIMASYNIGPETIGKGKEIGGHKFDQKKKGFIPSVVEELVNTRAKIKKELRQKKDPILEARSYAIKTITNATYGYLSYPRSRWYCHECSESITHMGRKHIKEVISKAEKNGFGVCYGDSLPGSRKIFVQTPDNEIKLLRIDELAKKNINGYKTLSLNNDKVIFSPIIRVIKHEYTEKEKGKLLELTTTHGKTIVTPQHSIYTKNKELIDATKLKVGDELISLTNPLIETKYKEGFTFDVLEFDLKKEASKVRVYQDNLKFKPGKKSKCPYCGKERVLYSHVSNKHGDRKLSIKQGLKSNHEWIGYKNAGVGRIPRFWKLSKELAWVLGFYCAEGSLSEGEKNMLSFGNQNIKLIQKVKKYFDKVLKSDLKIIKNFDKRNKKFMYYYRVQRKPLIPLFKHVFQAGKGCENKRVPWFIYNSEDSIKKSFINGYLAGDGTKSKDKRYTTHYIQCTSKSKDLAIGIQLLLKSLKHERNHYGKSMKHVYWKYRKDKPKINTLRLQTAKNSEKNYCLTKIKSIKESDLKSKFVYDLEVKGAHNFVDAEGLILVHNTDSAFLLLKNKSKEDLQSFLKKVNKELPGIMELELEYYCPRGLFISDEGGQGVKKRYALIDEKGELIIKGFEFVRGDWSEISKETQYKVFNALLKEKDEAKAIKVVKDIIEDLKENKIPLNKLVIRKQLTRNLDKYKSIGPHVAVAKRLKKEGYPISGGSMIAYVVTEGKGLIREKAHTIKEIKKQDLKPDADYYINNQVIPSIERVFTALNVNEGELKGKSQKGLKDFF